MDEETRKYILTRTLPTPLDIERAKRILLDRVYAEVRDHGYARLFPGSQLVGYLGYSQGEFTNPTDMQPGSESLEKELVSVRIELAAREALVMLQSNGVLIAFGQPVNSTGENRNTPEIRYVRVPQNNNNVDSYSVEVPTIYQQYRLATHFREDERYRLASGGVYLSYLDQGKLPPRTKRCLQECIDAYRHGLYLSAVMTVGAASESLWMQLGHLLASKLPTATTALGKLLKQTAPSIFQVIQESWHVLESQCSNELNQAFKPIERQPFLDRAKNLCDRRNYAMHSDKADTEEPRFSYTETGLLLLDSIDYFNQLSRLIETIEALP